jgi:hypothetical protein
VNVKMPLLLDMIGLSRHPMAFSTHQLRYASAHDGNAQSEGIISPGELSGIVGWLAPEPVPGACGGWGYSSSLSSSASASHSSGTV